MAQNDTQSDAPVGLPADVAAELAAYPEIVIPPPVFAPTMFANGDRSALREDVPSRRWDDPPIVRRHPFEIYITGQASAGAWPTVKCARGTVCSPHQADEGFTIAHRTDSFTLDPDSLFFLETAFSADGEIASCELKLSGLPTPWTGYPKQFTADGLTWYHPIAHIRPALDPLESGEIVVGPGNYVIAQLTNTHLRVARECSMPPDAMVLHWKLVAGPGAVT